MEPMTRAYFETTEVARVSRERKRYYFIGTARRGERSDCPLEPRMIVRLINSSSLMSSDTKMSAAKKKLGSARVLCRAIDRKPNISMSHTLEHTLLRQAFYQPRVTLLDVDR